MVNLMLKLQSFMLKVFIIKKLNKKKSCIIDGTFVGKIVSIIPTFFSLIFLLIFFIQIEIFSFYVSKSNLQR